MAEATMAFMRSTNSRLEMLEAFKSQHEEAMNERSNSEEPVIQSHTTNINITAVSSPLELMTQMTLMETDDPLFAAASSSRTTRVVQAVPKSKFTLFKTKSQKRSTKTL